MSLTVGALTPAHHGTRARVTLTPTDTREGTLSHAVNPSYQRSIAHWWLIVPSTLPHFTHDALSLQWSGSATVTPLEGRA